jgi:hypothetical protein
MVGANAPFPICVAGTAPEAANRGVQMAEIFDHFESLRSDSMGQMAHVSINLVCSLGLL